MATSNPCGEKRLFSEPHPLLREVYLQYRRRSSMGLRPANARRANVRLQSLSNTPVATRRAPVNWSMVDLNPDTDGTTFHVCECTPRIKKCCRCKKQFDDVCRQEPTNLILRVVCHRYFTTPKGVRVMCPMRTPAYLQHTRLQTHSESDTRVQLEAKLVTEIKQFPQTVHKFFALQLFYWQVFSTLTTSVLSKHPTAFKRALCSNFGDVAKSSCSAGESMCRSDVLKWAAASTKLLTRRISPNRLEERQLRDTRLDLGPWAGHAIGPWYNFHCFLWVIRWGDMQRDWRCHCQAPHQVRGRFSAGNRELGWLCLKTQCYRHSSPITIGCLCHKVREYVPLPLRCHKGQGFVRSSHWPVHARSSMCCLQTGAHLRRLSD